MATKKRRSTKKKSTPGRVKALAWLLVVVLVAGVAGVKFFQSPRGHLFLLGRGFTGYYVTAQEEVDTALRGAVKDLGLAAALGVKRSGITVRGKRFSLLEWKIACGEQCDLLKINLALSRAARSCGASVLDSREDSSGRELRLEIGGGHYPTHSITVTAARPGGAGTGRERETQPRLAIVIDDFGYAGNGVIGEFLALDMPITCSVIPALPYSTALVERARAADKEVLLHLPMEPEEKRTYDVAPVTTEMSSAEIEAMVSGYLEHMDGVAGVNNHMGSKATGDERVMRAVLSVLKERRLFFLDSLTSPRSIAYNEARKLGVKTARNDLFIDDDTRDPAIIEERINRLIDRARRNGTAVGIGHPHRWTLEALVRARASLERSGVRLVSLSELVQ